MPDELYNSKFYANNILFHSISKQQLSQKINNDMRMLYIEPGRINMTEWFNFGVELDTKRTKFITYEENVLLANAEELANQIKYGKKYSVVEFFQRTKIYVGFYKDGVKINTKNTYITVYGLHHMIMEVRDGVDSTTGYIMLVTRAIKKFTDYTGFKDKQFDYPVSQTLSKLYFIDGYMYKPNWSISNNIASFKIDASNITLEEFEIPAIIFNDYIQAKDFKGHMCIKYPNKIDTYMCSDLILFQDPDDRFMRNISKFITHRHFEVPFEKNYYTVIIHDPKAGSVMDYPLYKFEQVIGDLDTNASLIPDSFLSYDDGLLEASAITSGGYIAEITKAFAKFPDLVKHLIEAAFSLNLYPANLSEYGVYSNNKFIPTIKNKWQDFTEPCYYFKLPCAGSYSVVFVDGLAIVPDYIYREYSVSHVFFKKTRIQNKKVLVWTTSLKTLESHSYTVAVDSSMVCKLPPHVKTTKFLAEAGKGLNVLYRVIEEDYATRTSRIVTGWKLDIDDDDRITFTFTPDDVGKTYRIYNLDGAYYAYYEKAKYMAFELPWYLNYSEGDLFMWVDGRMTHQYHIPPDLSMHVLDHDVKMGINFMSNTDTGNDVCFLNGSHLDLYEQYDTLPSTDGVFTLNKKDYPFSKKYMMIFANGKLIHPDDIVEISTWTFAIKGLESTNDFRIYCKFIPEDFYVYKNEFMSTPNEWDTFVKTLTYTQLKGFTGATDVVNTETKYNIVDNPVQYWYEILYKYFIIDGRYKHAADNTIFELTKDFSAISTNGRIILDSNRMGNKARYIY